MRPNYDRPLPPLSEPRTVYMTELEAALVTLAFFACWMVFIGIMGSSGALVLAIFFGVPFSQVLWNVLLGIVSFKQFLQEVLRRWALAAVRATLAALDQLSR